MSTFFTKRNIIIMVVVLLLAVAIPLTLILVQQQTRLKSRAAAGDIIFKGPNVSPNPCNASGTQTCTATSSDIQIEVTSPFAL